MHKFIFPAALLTAIALGVTQPAQANQIELNVTVDFAAADTNSDNKLSKEELNTHLVTDITKQLAGQVGQQQAEAMAKQVAASTAKSMFEKADANLDGFLTQEELKVLDN